MIDPTNVRLLRISTSRTKKAWVLARMEWGDGICPEGYTLVDVPTGFRDIEGWADYKELIAYCYFQLTRYEVYRGKIREVRR